VCSGYRQARLCCAKIDVLPHKNKASEESPECVFVESNIVNFMTFLCAEIYKLCKLTLTAVNRRLSDSSSRTHRPIRSPFPVASAASDLLVYHIWFHLRKTFHILNKMFFKDVCFDSLRRNLKRTIGTIAENEAIAFQNIYILKGDQLYL